VGNGGEEIAAYYTAGAKNKTATQAFVMIHGKLRDGDAYWTTMDTVLNSAIKDNTPGVDPNAIVIAPQFFSAELNSGQYTSDQLAWGDINTWQAGDVAVHPKGTKLNSFDALNALVASLADKSTYPALTNITVVGHGGGGQLIQRYSMTAEVRRALSSFCFLSC
jgi:pimeloyl-ACP methyl ester carboxylesterase